MNNVPIKSLRRWVKVGYIRKKGGGRKVKDPKMEKKIYKWYLECCKHDIAVTPRMIKIKALEFSHVKEFNASKGWLAKFTFKYKSFPIFNIYNNFNI